MYRFARAVAWTAALMLSLPQAGAAPPENSTISYGAGIRYKTAVFEPRLLGLLHADGREPFLVFSGLGCQDCDINRNIYIYSLSDLPMESGERGDRYSHPGKYYDNETQSLYETVRMFVGRCLPAETEGVVWFSNSKLATGKWKKSTFVARVEGSKLVAKYVLDNAISLAAAQAAVARKICVEVPGQRFSAEP